MPRVKRGTVVNKRHKKLLSLTKGYKHGRSTLVRAAKQAMLRAGTYAFRDRRVKKRTFRTAWIAKVNAAVRAQDMTYSTFMAGVKKAGIELDRKVMAELIDQHPAEFDQIITKVKAALK